MKLIGISGTNGSGKDAFGMMLAKEYNFLFISGSDMLRDECRARGLPVERENLRMISAEWRRASGLGVILDKGIAIFNASKRHYDGLAMASLRNPGEAERVHELGGRVVWLDADSKVRYERIQASTRGRGGEDDVTYEQFLAAEAAEMHSTGDVATLNMAGVKALADIFLVNEADMATLQADAAQALSL